MVYVYKKMIAGKPYYYLRASSISKGKSVVKDIAYLGNSIENAKKEIERLPQFKDKIEKSYRKIRLFLESNHYLEGAQKAKLKHDDFLKENQAIVEACALHYNKAFKKLDALTQKEILDNFIVEYAFNTTAIEGNTIGLKEARGLLEEGLTPKDKTLREIHDLQNTKRVFESLDLKRQLSRELIKEIHAGLLENIDSRNEYRIRDIMVTKSRFKPSPYYKVREDMDFLLEWFDKNKKLHPFVLAVIFHHKFEKIHPFMDGNGRTGRMLMNFILLKNNYPPEILQKKHRSEYLEILNEADKAFITEAKPEHYAGLIAFATAELNETYWNNFL
ncbi:MAG: Fic family protein [Candidatus Diapherotrites archaeon]|nr:Fic family protein [Candidatus Diapherotrites archaeon]